MSQIEGVLQHVDECRRELRVQTGEGACDVYLPPGCAVIVNHEPVRLHFLQIGDHVRVEYALNDGVLAAQRVELLLSASVR